jgi:branched-chain amino acid transport system ATP-binding protein
MTVGLRVENLEVRYGKLTAVDDLSLFVPPGRLVLLLGTNGAGKSSCLNAVAGTVRPRRGRITIGQTDVTAMPSHRRAQGGLGYLPEGRGVFPSLTVSENIIVGASGRREVDAARDSAFELFPRLEERQRQVAGSLSGGEQQMLSLARCLAGNPKVLLLDELSLGLAPAVVQALFQAISALRDRGVTILLVEQFAHAALAIADECGIVVRGRLTRYGPASEVARLDPDHLAALYFGGEHA